jgi:hypothetical protein
VISSNPEGRFSEAYMQGKAMEVIAEDSRANMATMERIVTERAGGPSNLESSAGSEYCNQMELVTQILKGAGGG